MLLISARHLVMLYICAKFHEIIMNDIKVIEWTRFLYGKLQRGICCIVVLRPRSTSKVMSGRSVNLTTLSWAGLDLLSG